MSRLLPETLRNKLPALYSQEQEADPMVYGKLYSTILDQQWYLLEFDGQELLFNYCVSNGEGELGYASLSELEAARYKQKIVFAHKGGRSVAFMPVAAVERDHHFVPCRLSSVKELLKEV